MGTVDDDKGEFVCDPALTFKHEYPATKLMFCPDKEGSRPDLLATTGEFLRVWKIAEDGSGVTLERNLNNVRFPARPPTGSMRCVALGVRVGLLLMA